jgi:hypothetical protein
MLNPDEREAQVNDFSELEASFRLEGMDPSGDPIYEAAKAAVLSGEMTLDEAIEFAMQGSVAELEPVHTTNA